METGECAETRVDDADIIDHPGNRADCGRRDTRRERILVFADRSHHGARIAKKVVRLSSLN